MDQLKAKANKEIDYLKTEIVGKDSRIEKVNIKIWNVEKNEKKQNRKLLKMKVIVQLFLPLTDDLHTK